MRAVVDPGVLVSAALNPSGAPARLVDAARTGRLVMVVSEQLIAELDDVLGRERIASRLDAQALRRLRHVLAEALPCAASVRRCPVTAIQLWLDAAGI